MHTEKQTIWLSRDDERGDRDTVFVWNKKPRFCALGGPASRKRGWTAVGSNRAIIDPAECSERYGCCPQPGICFPVVVTTSYSPGAVVHAPPLKETGDGE